MNLILWRHADADYSEPDLARPLTPKGHKQAARVAEWLERNLPSSCRILVSPAVRAQQTVAALGRKFTTVPVLAPDCSVGDLLTVADWPNSRDSVLIVGHQPTLGAVAAFLLTNSTTGLSVRKGSAWWLANRSREDDAQVVLRALVNPDLM